MEKLIHTKITGNFVYPEIKDTDFVFGSGEVIGTVLNDSGDWRNYLPPHEFQNKNGVESSACFIEAQQHTIATILEKQYSIHDSNFSSRFNLIFSDATPLGGSPLKGAQTIRDHGVIPEQMLPFADYIQSWQEFNSFEGGNKGACIVTGQIWLQKWEPKYDIVFLKNDSVETKYRKLREALKFSPVCASVYAWVEDPVSGFYVKPDGYNDQHLVEIIHVDENNSVYVLDTYEPFIKRLNPNFNFDFGMRWSLFVKDTAPAQKKYWFTDIFIKLSKLIKQIIWK